LIVAYTSAIFGTTIVLITMLILLCGVIYSLHKEEEVNFILLIINREKTN
jgi:hypothetical protein